MKKLVRVLLIVILSLFYLYPGIGLNTKLDFFVPLAQSFWQGKIYVSEMREELHEMVSEKEIKSGIPEEPVDGVVDKYYVIYPPMPALVLMPFVAIWGSETNQSTVSVLLSLCSIYLAFLVFRERKLGRRQVILLTLLYAFGSSVWYHALVGSSWYIASIVAMLFMWLSILMYLRKRYYLAGIFWGMAFLARLPVILALPFFFVQKELSGEKLRKVLLPIGFSVIIFLAYNYARYGRLDNYGYKLLESRWYNINYEYGKGSYDLSYVGRHFQAFFLALPERIKEFPYFYPNMDGMAVWIVFPAMLILMAAPYGNKFVQASVLSILAIIPAHFLHGGVGATQFGYRYMFDYLPFIMLIIGEAMRQKVKLWMIAFICFSILVNIWGILSLLN